ncbi:3-hydroxyisobutyrate dehydrogenase-like beta-hydroxyacid dehydrogenase [Paenarthrobacter nicotinovorans]|uniref:3-hydroxyisobutyrate dehydrogenase-like beta-hydroxyacid dehydrogenase n=1 Tax=Paenarthrobacter nicotinovorans TaxID=29320 RepID=A0ABT9TRP9_PAENI|nr:NAD(P)-dependent oxidoreductase [Paenarthrobacter nicotinovorans]MDQ0104347.1 3-hydroxyisobutyrate dehydrogenase-like beta-hydroxyacid dehydrogenase [Paenarthrobacter nicotinovorans]GAT88290.1 2-hydroxy-3-oxopropionate reductase [Paenarthrobacter nicotinovorans]
MTTLGFLGLGSMGSGIARRLLDAGHDVLVWNRSPDAADRLVAAGARRAQQPAEAFSAEVSFSMLANDKAVLSILDESAIRLLAGRTHVVMASISPSLADRLAAAFDSAGAAYVAAPVLGRPDVAAAGQLNILAAGPPAALDQVQPYFDVMGKRTWQIGDRPSVANAVKASVNYNIIHALQAIGETVAMVERQGVDPGLFTELLSSTLFGGVVYAGYGDLIARGDYTPPGFQMALGRKDLGLAEEVAASSGVAPATLPALKAVFDRALADPVLKESDWSAIAEVSRQDLL